MTSCHTVEHAEDLAQANSAAANPCKLSNLGHAPNFQILCILQVGHTLQCEATVITVMILQPSRTVDIGNGKQIWWRDRSGMYYSVLQPEMFA